VTLSSLQFALVALASIIACVYVWAFCQLDYDRIRQESRFESEGHLEPLLAPDHANTARQHDRPIIHGDMRDSRFIHSQASSPHAEETSNKIQREMTFPFADEKYRIYSLPEFDPSIRCKLTGICDGNHSCGPDGMGCIIYGKDRQQRVREAARWSWAGYRQFAWGHDEVDAGSKRPHDWFDIGLTIVDSLDTLLILGLEEEFYEARQWVANHLDFDKIVQPVSTFETTIRVLGGLASAFYHSGGDELFLKKAVDFGERLLPSINTSTGIAVPRAYVGKGSKAARPSSASGTILAEAGTISMEFSSITHLTGRPEFREAGMLFWYSIAFFPDTDGLYCTQMDGLYFRCNGHHYTFGSMADSAYEYMLKQWVLSNGEDEVSPLILTPLPINHPSLIHTFSLSPFLPSRSAWSSTAEQWRACASTC
jgi:hypothetical protein